MKVGDGGSWIYINDKRICELTREGYSTYLLDDLPQDLRPSCYSESYDPKRLYPLDVGEFFDFISTLPDRKAAIMLAKRAGFL